MPILKITKTTSTSWEDIANDPSITIGSEVSFTLENGDMITCEVAHGSAYGANKILVFKDCYGEECMNRERTNKGGYAKSFGRKHAEKIYQMFSTELKEQIVPRIIKQKINGEIHECECKVWHPSQTEMVGDLNNYNKCDVDDVHFDLYDTEKSRVKECEGYGTWWYFTRTPTSGLSTSFMGVSYSGNSNYISAASSNGVCLGFCLGRQEQAE